MCSLSGMMWSLSGMMWSLPVVVFVLAMTLGTSQGQCTSGSPPCQLTCRCSDTNSCPAGVPSRCASEGCQPGWSGATCQRQNAVYRFTNSQETPWTLGSRSTSGTFYMAFAFDGLPDTEYRSNYEDNPYLWVKLPNRMYVYSMRIITRGTNTGTQTAQIHVSDSNTFTNPRLCYEGTITTTSTTYNIKCTPALLGQYVRIHVLAETTLIVQGWEIYKCASYWFGDGCSRLCNCRTATQLCNEFTGHCESGCPDGYTGTDCYTVCPSGRFGTGCQGVCHCENQTSCNNVDGKCDGQDCATGYKGWNCQQVCPLGQFGERCEGACHCKNEACNHVNGICDTEGCAAGFTGDSCQDECEDGQFWENCELRCHCVNSEPCHKDSGVCPSGCAPGFTGPNCHSVCPDKQYGLNCTSACNCVRSEPCDKVTGSCEGGCSPGYTGPDCQSECPSGSFGSECAHQCNCYDENEVCDRVNGTCQTGCADGHVGRGCLKVANAGACDQSWGLIAAVIILGVISAALVVYAIVATRKWHKMYQEIKARYVTYNVKPEERTSVYEEVGPAPTQLKSHDPAGHPNETGFSGVP